METSASTVALVALLVLPPTALCALLVIMVLTYTLPAASQLAQALSTLIVRRANA